MYKMEVDKILSHSAYALPVGGVLILAVLVFVFGFKSVAEPTFEKITSEGKKKKAVKQPKTKKISLGNGSASPIAQTGAKKATTVASPALPKPSPVKASIKKDSPNKKATKGEQKVSPAVEVTKADKKNIEKSLKKEPKPADYDDGDWQSVNKKEKKKRVDGASNNVSPVASPSHRLNKKENEKEKGNKKKVEEVKKVSEAVTVNGQVEEKKEDVAPPAPPKEVIVEKNAAPEKATAKAPQDVKEDKETIEERPEAPKSALKEKNNNNAINSQKSKPPKPQVEEKTPETQSPVEEESEDPWQENKAAKKKKKARRE